MNRMYACRLRQLKQCVPWLFEVPGTLLYVGANHKRAHYLAELVDVGYEVTLLEVHWKNVEFYQDNPLLQNIIWGDVQDLDILRGKRWNVAFWWHGPEHVFAHNLSQALSNLEGHADLVILGCPWGFFKQHAVFGNPNEEHVSAYHPEDFKRLGYKVATLGLEDVRSSNLLAWKGRNGNESGNSS